MSSKSSADEESGSRVSGGPQVAESDAWYDEAKTIRKWTLKAGTGFRCPRHRSRCTVLVAKLVGGPSTTTNVDLGFDVGRPADLTVGECDTCVGRVVEKVLFAMRPGEVCRVSCSIPFKELTEDFTGGVSQEEPASNETVAYDFELELLDFEPQPDMHELGDAEKCERALDHKQKGVELFKLGKPRKAFYRFSKATKHLVFVDDGADDDLKKRRDELLLNCHANMAACQLETGLYELAVENCDDALRLDDRCVKALYRRAVAHTKLNNLPNAREDLRRVLKLEPKNGAAKKQLEKIHEANQELDKYYAKQMKKLFA